MRVALVGEYPLDPACICGGVEAATYCLAQGLRSYEDIDLHVFVAKKGLEVDRTVQDGTCTVHYIAVPARRFVSNQISNVSRLRTAIEQVKPDVVHSGIAEGSLAGLQAGYPTVHTVHGVIHRELPLTAGWRFRISMSILHWLTKRAMSRLKHVIAVSRYAGEVYAPMTRAKIHYIPNAIDDFYFDLENREIPGRMFYAGHVNILKNVKGMVVGFKNIRSAHPNAQLNIAGDIAMPSDIPYRKDVEDYIVLHGLTDSVRLMGRIPNCDIAKQYSEASIVCLFSNHETFSLTIGQGMAAGKAVVATDCGGPSDLVVDGENGFLIAMNDVQAFAEKSVVLLSDSALRVRMGKRGKEIANELYRKEAVADRTLQVYREALRELPYAKGDAIR